MKKINTKDRVRKFMTSLTQGTYSDPSSCERATINSTKFVTAAKGIGLFTGRGKKYETCYGLVSDDMVDILIEAANEQYKLQSERSQLRKMKHSRDNLSRINEIDNLIEEVYAKYGKQMAAAIAIADRDAENEEPPIAARPLKVEIEVSELHTMKQQLEKDRNIIDGLIDRVESLIA